MIMEREILKGEECPPEYKDNLLELLIRMNKVRDAYGRPMIVTSGYRSAADHIRIYKSLGIPANKIPWGSCHLTCQAVDIYDPDGELFEWCVENDTLLREIGVWLEEKDDQKRVHFQIKPFRSYKPSGSIFFKP